MSFVVILSKEDKTFFSFDEMCLYKNGKPKNEKLDEMPLEIFRYLAEFSPELKTYDEIFNEVWVIRTKKQYALDKCPDDGTIKQHILTLHRYLEDKKPFKFIQSGSKSYKSTVKIFDTEMTFHNSEILSLGDQLDKVIEELENIQVKIDRAKKDNDENWIRIYTDQFQRTLFKYDCIQQKIKLVEKEIQDVRWIFDIQEVNSESKSVENANSIENKLNELIDKKDMTRIELDKLQDFIIDKICESLASDQYNFSDLENILDKLPQNRKIALMLLDLIDMYEIPDLFEILFDKYTIFLSKQEYDEIINKVKFIFDPIIYERWIKD